MSDNVRRLRTARDNLHKLEDRGIVENNLTMEQITAIRIAEFAIDEICSTDVQPVDRWISVKDRLPDKFENVLCYCKTTTGEGNEFMFGAYHNDTWWLKTCRTYATLEQPQMRVIYWMPLPKPPKDGEQE
jgi:hypothetical protein